MKKINWKNGEAPYLSEENLNQMQKNIEEEINTINEDVIIDKVLNKNEGYIKYENGYMRQWKTLKVKAGGTKYGELYYSDHIIGNWIQPFTNLFGVKSSADKIQFWTSEGGQNNTSAGTVRTYRPENTITDTTLYLEAHGLWK